jgi:hypothetical protein
MFKSTTKIAIGAGIALALIGCAGPMFPYPTGGLYNGTQTPSAINRNETSGPGKSGDKSGEACATGILSAVAFGDASIDAAKKAGGITEVHSVENHVTSILGFVYVQGCTEVHGK